MGSKKSVTIGYRYYMGIHMGICRGPVNALVAVDVGGKTAWSGSVTASGRVSINKPGLFGGDKKEGGIVGPLDVMMGEPSQLAPAGLASMLGGDVPGFRGVLTAYFNGQVSAMSPYIKPWKFRVRRTTAGWDGAPWYPGKAKVELAAGAIHAMNPAHIVYECLTNRDWGGGMDRSRLDEESFRAAADALYSEGFGLCLRWNRSDTVSAFVQEVLDHIGGNLYLSRFDGLFHLTLIRDDYAVDDLPLFDEDSGLLGIDDDDNAATAGALNELVVKWRDPITGDDRSWRERNLGAVMAAGQVLTETREYVGLPTEELAGRVAVRELRAAAAGLKRFKVRLDRRGYRIEPGEAFRIRSVRRGIEQMVVRAGRIEDGTLSESTITITAVQDVFGLPATSMTSVQPSGWVAPDPTPQPITVRRLQERTWRDIAQATDPANLALVDATDCYLQALAVKPTSMAQAFTLQARVGTADWVDADSGDFCPSALLAAPVGPADTAISLTAAVDLDFVEPGGAVLIGDEIVRLVGIDADAQTAAIARGCVDTVPVAHAAGTRVWFVEGGGAVDPLAYSPGTTVQARLLTESGSGQLDPALAAVDSLLMAQRAARPYPPGNLRVNGASYPVAVTGEVTVSCAHRDRLLQADQLIDTTIGDIGPEPGTQYRFRFYSGSVLKREVLQAGAAYNYPLATEISDGGPFNPLRIVVDAVRSGLYSHQAHDISVERLGLVTAPPIRLSLTPSAFGAGTTSHMVAMPASVAAGDLLLMQFVNDGSATVAVPAGWTLLTSNNNSTAVRSSWFYRIASGAEGGTSVDLVTSAAEHGAAQVHRFQSGTFDPAVAPAVAVATGSSVSPNPPALSPAWGEADTYWIAAYGADDDDATTGWPLVDGQTYTPSGTGTTTCSAASCVLALRVASIDPGLFTMAATEEWIAATVAIKPVGL
jgi:hypothetical protein